MNRTNLIQLMATVAATTALCGLATGATPQEPAKELDVTRNAWLECLRAAIPPLDHPESTSETVARAAINSCSDQYTAMLGAVSHTLPAICAQDSDCRRAALAKAGQEAVKSATDEVVTARIRVAGAQVLVCQ